MKLRRSLQQATVLEHAAQKSDRHAASFEKSGVKKPIQLEGGVRKTRAVTCCGPAEGPSHIPL
jgi:hypothetical protein